MPLPKDHPYYKPPLETDPNATRAEHEGEHFDLDRALEGLGEPLDTPDGHRSGYVNIVGRPNVGKSTLLNALVGERMSIITAKPQTTRHRILALVSGPDFQAVFSDTPGLIEEPGYKMQERMNAFVASAFEDADVVLFVVVPQEEYPDDHPLLRRLANLRDAEVIVVVNKADTVERPEAERIAEDYRVRLSAKRAVAVSALHGDGTDALRADIIAGLPAGPAYYPKDQLSDRSERFFVTEIIREQILEHYYQEIPYAVEPVVERFEHGTTSQGKPIIRISVVVYVERDSQKNILIGPGGRDIKEVGRAARERLERFFDSKVFLETRVKVRKGWRDDEKALERFGYDG